MSKTTLVKDNNTPVMESRDTFWKFINYTDTPHVRSINPLSGELVLICTLYEEGILSTSKPFTRFNNATTNGHLIAAAPDMLDAIKIAISWLEGSDDKKYSSEDVRKLLHKVIRKAEGSNSVKY